MARWDRKSERRADRALVAAYHEARLGELVDYVAEAVDRFRGGEQDAYAVDKVLHRYSRAARELWKFCWLGGGAGVERTRVFCATWPPSRSSPLRAIVKLSARPATIDLR